MRNDDFAKRRLRELVRDELMRIGLRTIVQETVRELQFEFYEPEQRRRPKLKVVE